MLAYRSTKHSFRSAVLPLRLLMSGTILLGGLAANAADVDLGTLNGTNGVAFYGGTAGDACGYFLSGVGDINKDGFGDILIGSPLGDGPSNARADAGECFLVKGRSTAFPAAMELSGMGSSNGFVIYGPTAGDLTGNSLSAAGDVNRDGFADFLVGARQGDGVSDLSFNSGESYLVFGKSASFGTSLDLRSPGSNAITFWGATGYDLSGSATGSADVNGDGFWDVIIGAINADGPTDARYDAGEGYVIYGKSSPATINLSSLNDTTGVNFLAEDTLDGLGRSASGLGDVNGDGLADLVMGARYSDGPGNTRTYAGDSYIVFGNVAGLGTSIEMETLDGSNGFIVHGAESTDRTSFSVSGVGDFNGDGNNDIIIVGRLADGPGNTRTDAGEAYLIYGKSTGFAAEIDLATLAHPDGSVIHGAEAGDRVVSVGSAGDFNGDGYFDIMIGAYRADGISNLKTDSGEAYLIYGRPGGLGSTFDLATMADADGIRFLGANDGDAAGVSVACAGDVNGDGYSDVLIGARYADGPADARLNVGECYLVFGGPAPIVTNAVYKSTARAGNAPRIAIGTNGTGSDEFAPSARCWIDFNGGDNGSGGASLETVTLSRSSTSSLPFSAKVFWRLESTRTGWTNAALTFKYMQSEVSHLEEDTIRVYQASSPDGPWTLLPTTLDQALNTAGVSASTLSYFALAGDPRPFIPLGIELLDTPINSLDAVRFGVEFSELVTPSFTADDVSLTGTLAGNAIAAVTAMAGDPFYQIVVAMDDPEISGTIGVQINGVVSDHSTPPNDMVVPVDSAFYTIINYPEGDLNHDGVVDIADVAMLADINLGLATMP